MEVCQSGTVKRLDAYVLVHFGFLVGTLELRKTFMALLLAGYGLLLVYLTLILHHTSQRLPPHSRSNLVILRTVGIFLQKGGMEMVVNILGNLAVFIPIGFLLPLIRTGRTSFGFVVAISAGLSLLIELLQFFTGYRVADIDDVLLNTISGAIGYALFRTVYWMMLRTGVATDP